MKKDTFIYRKRKIYLNRFGEYNVLNKEGGAMESYNSSFKSLSEAKKYIDKLNK
jgi:hypothetical protein